MPNIGKLYEILINKSIVKYVNKNRIIPYEQFGFREKNSTLHAASKFSSDVAEALSGGEFVAACLVDLEKAFDSVWIKGLIFRLIKKGFSPYLIKLIWNMLKNRRMFVSLGDKINSKEYELNNGLQQGAVNSPILFNIYISDLLRAYGLNGSGNKKGIGFADDIIVYCIHRKVTQAERELQLTFKSVCKFFGAWKLSCNYNKCESILFRPLVHDMSRECKTTWREFRIQTDNNNINEAIENKTVVKYLGIYFDNRLKFNTHIESTLDKAKKAFFKFKNLFMSRKLNEKVKILCYVLLIRPIIAYGCLLWFGISPSQMEKIRIFERDCLRSCLGKYRDPETGYERHLSNVKLYNLANIPRIDVFVIGLVRDHIAKAIDNSTNPLIPSIFEKGELTISKLIKMGYLSPETFTILDKHKFIQNENNVPILYHIYRHARDRIIKFNSIDLLNNPNIALRYSTSLPDIDTKKSYRTKSTKYKWLT